MTNAKLAQWDSAVVSYCFVWEFFLTLSDLLLVCYSFRSCIFTGFVFVLCFWASVALFLCCCCHCYCSLLLARFPRREEEAVERVGRQG